MSIETRFSATIHIKIPPFKEDFFDKCRWAICIEHLCYFSSWFQLPSSTVIKTMCILTVDRTCVAICIVLSRGTQATNVYLSACFISSKNQQQEFLLQFAATGSPQKLQGLRNIFEETRQSVTTGFKYNIERGVERKACILQRDSQ